MFRQMNQEHVTLWHVVDVRLGVVQVFDKDRTQLSYHGHPAAVGPYWTVSVTDNHPR